MQKSNPYALAGVILGVLLVLAGADILKGGLYIGKHEGDAYQFIDIVMRMAQGEVAHRDFMTPIGALAFAPVVLLVKAGLGIGHAVLWAQVIIAAVVAPPLWWIAQRRLGPLAGVLFSVVVMVLILALVHGEAQRSVSISMHYNRWAWAAAYIAVLAAILPPDVPRRAGSEPQAQGTLDGVIVGAAMLALLMIKVTYFAAFVIPVVLGLVLTGQRRTLLIALLTGLAGMAALSAWLGLNYWTAYIGDLLTVARSDIRPQPGEPFSAILGAPAYIGGSLVAVASVILLRRAGAATGGLVLLTLLPGFFYVTYQNFGNDPQWLPLLAVIVLALRPAQEVTHGAGPLTLAAAMALALGAPSFFNLAYSPFRHLAVDTAKYAPLLPDGGRNADLQTLAIRANRVDARVAMDGPGSGLEAYRAAAERDPAPSFEGQTFPICSVQLGLPLFFRAIAQDMEGAGYTGARIFTADLLSPFWLLGDFRPLAHAAPWYYGGLPGFAGADYLLVPVCPIEQDVQTKILDAVKASGETLTEVRRTPLYILYARG